MYRRAEFYFVQRLAQQQKNAIQPMLDCAILGQQDLNTVIVLSETQNEKQPVKNTGQLLALTILKFYCAQNTPIFTLE